MNSEPPAFPKAIDDDDDDVAWALQTAAVQWERGGHADAVVWLRRAAQAAVESGEFGRAADLERGAREVEGWVERGVVGPEPDLDDGVDSLLEGPSIEAVALEGPTASLVDALEAEAREQLPSTEDLDEADIEDLPDVQDVEDITSEASSPPPAPPVDEEESAPLPLRSRSKRPRVTSDAPDEPTIPPPPGGRAYKLPPPPIPRLPLPAPRTPVPAEPLPVAAEPAAPAEPVAAFEPPMRSLPVPPSELAPEPRESVIPRERLLSEADPVLQSEEVEFPAPAPPPAASVPVSAAPSAAKLDPALLAACRGLEDLPPETQESLAARARVEVLSPEQEVSDFGLALVTRGSVLVMPTIAEAACGRAVEGEPVFAQGNLAEGVTLRVVAEAQGAEVAVWQREDFEQLLVTCPWVAEELRAVADRYQALAGAAMGPLGDRLDDGMRAMITERAEVRFLAAGDTVLEQGNPVAGLLIVGGGRMELVVDGAVTDSLGPGDLPFASAVLSHAKAPATVRAGEQGALVLSVDRMATHELLVSVPPLLELLATS